MTENEMFEKSFQRPSNYFKLDGERQWDIDKSLGILDWEGDLSVEEYTKFINHYDFTPSKKKQMIDSYTKKKGK
jgi:hypothetical protein